MKSDSTAWRGRTFGGGTTCGGVQYMWGVYMVEGLYNMWGVTVGGFYPKFRSWFHFKLKFHTLLLISQMRPWYRPAMGVFVIRPSTKNASRDTLWRQQCPISPLFVSCYWKYKDQLVSVGTPKNQWMLQSSHHWSSTTCVALWAHQQISESEQSDNL